MIRLARVLTALAIAAGVVVVALNQQALERIDARFVVALLAAQLPLLLAQLLMAVRLRSIVSLPAAGFRHCLQAGLLAQAGDVVLPARLSELLRAGYLRQMANVPFSAGLAAIVVERIADIVTVAMLIVAAAFLVIEADATFFVVSALGLGLALVALPVLTPWLDRALRYVPIKPLAAFASRLLHEVVQRQRDGRFWRALVPTLAIWLLGLIATWAFFAVAGLFADARLNRPVVTVVVMVFVLTTIGNAVALLPGSLGTYEAGVVVALGACGIPFEESLPLAFGLHVAHLFIGVLGGGFVFVRSSGELKAILATLRRTAP